MHDGALVAGNHLFVYVRQADGKWWKAKDHEVTSVRFGIQRGITTAECAI